MYDGVCRCGRALSDNGICYHCDGGGVSPSSLKRQLKRYEQSGMKVTRLREAKLTKTGGRP